MDSLTKMTKLGLPPLFHAQGANFTGNASNPFPPGMVDSFLATAGQASPLMQLFLFIYRQIGVQFGLDPSLLLTMLGVLWGLSKILTQVYGMLQVFNSRYLMCALYVGENDHIYSHIMNFLAHQQNIAKDRYLMAQTVWKSAWEEEEEMANALTLIEVGDGDDDDEPKYLNFASQAARSSPRYVPAMGTTGFWHNGTYFRVNRKKESFMNTSGWSAMKDLEEIKISCFGRSIDPIKQLLADAKTMYYLDTRQKTTIYRPSAKESRRDGHMWHQVARRPVRPMRTVVLDSKEKHDVLRDVNEYLHPGTPRWYASRGIPLRRGYLFHGPPGTGKTSFSFALAGVFGIDIYVISLQDISVTEEDLAALFTRLPRRCIVLLEDIDTAGLRRDPDEDAEEDAKEDADEKKDDAKDAKKSKKSKESKKSKKKSKKEDSDGDSDNSESDSDSSEDEKSKKKKKKTKSKRKQSRGMSGILTVESISLSGLLNAIDGVASHEGRILIMTTNKPESLDEALIRPGRVDVQVGFKNASSVQAAELFHRMYEAKRAKLVSNGSASGPPKTPSQAETENGLALKQTEGLGVTTEELRKISVEFGKLIPEGMFSPAEIQGFLLKRKKTPQKALDDASEWIGATIKQKESKSKVVTVQ
ncbi:mitochondrial chaperone bcs1 [Ilyonectria sp. MPI-CAGE-AT-0026]|nr:mitochondrial chaperone bcs1 [Ilyonectria sp. MPI-CAGE-AT-0026]